jgi:hypothetical protein
MPFHWNPEVNEQERTVGNCFVFHAPEVALKRKRRLAVVPSVRSPTSGAHITDDVPAMDQDVLSKTPLEPIQPLSLAAADVDPSKAQVPTMTKEQAKHFLTRPFRLWSTETYPHINLL